MYQRLVELLGEARARELFERARAAVDAHPRAPWVPDDAVETAWRLDRLNAELFRVLREHAPKTLRDPVIAEALGLCDLCGSRVSYAEIMANGGAWHTLCVRELDELDEE